MVCSNRTSSWYRLAAAAASPSSVSSCSTAESACCLWGTRAVTYRVGSVSESGNEGMHAACTGPHQSWHKGAAGSSHLRGKQLLAMLTPSHFHSQNERLVPFPGGLLRLFKR